MAAISSAASGNWSAGATWVGGVAPTSADTATILNTHTVTLDTTGCVCSTLTVNSGGTLAVSTTASSSLTSQGDITVNSGGTWTCDLSAYPTINCTINGNGASTAAGTKFKLSSGSNGTLKGAVRKRVTTVTSGALSAGATSCTVADATGWRTGDTIIFATTAASLWPVQVDVVENITVSGSNISWSTGLTYAHAADCLVGNFTSNVTVRALVDGDRFIVRADLNSTACTRDIRDVCFRGLKDTTTFAEYAFSVDFGSSSNLAQYTNPIQNNAFYKSCGALFFLRTGTLSSISFKDNIFHNDQAFTFSLFSSNNIYSFKTLEIDGVYVFQGCGSNSGSYQISIQVPVPATLKNVYLSGFQQSSTNSGALSGPGVVHQNFNAWSCGVAIYGYLNNPLGRFENSTFGTLYSGAACQYLINGGVYSDATLVDCDFSSVTLTAFANSVSDATRLRIFNKNGDAAVQEIYGSHSNTIPIIQRDASLASKSAASVLMTCNNTAAITHSFDVLAKAGETITLIGYVRKSGTPAYGSSTLPSITISGLGITPVVATMAGGTAADTWEKLTVNATNSGASDGLLTVTFTAQSATAGAKAYFSGIPVAPFVTRCRHYGYLFDETIPTRTTDLKITESTEATAAAYTGASFNTGAKEIAFSAGTIDTWNELYDYSRAWGTQNILSEMPFDRAGGSCILTTGWTVVDPTITGVTWSGGTVQYNSTGTKADDLDGCIVEFNVSGGGTFTFSGTISGTLDLQNLDASAITVELPSGAGYTTANNTGGTITVTLPTVSADINITSMPTAAAATTRLQLINYTASQAAAWQATTAYSAGDVVLRTSGVGTESTAGLYMRCTTAGTSAGTEPTWDTTVGNTTADGSVVWTTYAVLFYDADPVTASYSTTYTDGNQFLAGESAKVRFAEMDGATSFKRYATTLVAAASGFSTAVEALPEDVYATKGLDGSAQDGIFSPDYVANYLILDTNTDFSGASMLAYLCYLQTTSQGMYFFWGGFTAVDPGNLRFETDVISLYLNESGGFVKQTDDMRIFRKDGLRPAIDPTTGGAGIEVNWKVPVSVVATGGSALTPTESAHLMSLANAPAASTVADAVWSKTLP